MRVEFKGPQGPLQAHLGIPRSRLPASEEFVSPRSKILVCIIKEKKKSTQTFILHFRKLNNNMTQTAATTAESKEHSSIDKSHVERNPNPPDVN